jgi:hypothetical protein
MHLYLSCVLKFDTGPFYNFVKHLLNSVFRSPLASGTYLREWVEAKTLENIGLYYDRKLVLVLGLSKLSFKRKFIVHTLLINKSFNPDTAKNLCTLYVIQWQKINALFNAKSYKYIIRY